MFKKADKKASRAKRHLRVRKKVSGTAERPRLSVFKSCIIFSFLSGIQKLGLRLSLLLYGDFIISSLLKKSFAFCIGNVSKSIL